MATNDWTQTRMNEMWKKHVVGVVAFLMAWGACVNASAGEGEATRVVTELQESIVTIMKKGRDLGYTGRYQSISPTVEKTHDLDTIARLAVGRHWKGLEASQRSAFIETFKDLSISMYAGRFKDYGGEQFTILSETSLKRGNRKLVASHFVKSGGEKISFNYVLHQVHGQWKIISVSVNGVSDLALKRTEYGGILRKDGFPTLIERLKSQIDKNANGL
ncbi:MAG: transporter [Nitrospira sp. SB0677_bin_15]|nr:transporter [Nitrospira sp. SB0667_bin_9]MYG41284.1 transporter [Nitrospira sp. SB0677_bin_15]MYH02982.1 transporter [Nitrospira sp. SB0675_bin_23]